MRIAIIDPAAGISGDMTLGALLSLGLPVGWLEELPAQIPVAFGGAAVPPGGAASLKGTGLADIDYTPWLHVGTDTSAATGFQGDFATVHVDDDSAQVGAIGRIQEGVNLVSGSTVLVAPGTYDELVTISSDVTLLSTGGKAVTTIQNTAGTGLGTVVVVGPTTGVQIGGVNQGFTIIGTDGPPGIEEAAIYFQGNHSNAKVIGNNVVAAGDAALTTEHHQNLFSFDYIECNSFL